MKRSHSGLVTAESTPESQLDLEALAEEQQKRRKMLFETHPIHRQNWRVAEDALESLQ